MQSTGAAAGLEIPDKLNCSNRVAECVNGREDVWKRDIPSAATFEEPRGPRHQTQPQNTRGYSAD